VVSVATPSLLSQGLPFSSMPTAYNTGEYVTCVHLGLGQVSCQKRNIRYVGGAPV
jgi:hypothetical protein